MQVSAASSLHTLSRSKWRSCDLLIISHGLEWPRRALALTNTSIMTSRINIGRPVAPSYNADPHGFANSRPSSGYRAADPDDPLEKVRVWGKQVEDAIEVYSQPLRPHLPAIGRFLIVVTFFEDALRIVTQWSDQLWYLQTCASRFASLPRF